MVIAIIAILAALLLPAFAPGETESGGGVYCMNNLRNLDLAWHMYAGDNGEKLAKNSVGSPLGTYNWVAGWMSSTRQRVKPEWPLV